MFSSLSFVSRLSRSLSLSLSYIFEMNLYAFHLRFISLLCSFKYLFISFNPPLPSLSLSLSFSLFRRFIFLYLSCLSHSLFVYPSGFSTPHQRYPLLLPLLPSIAAQQSTEWSQFEHASLRITKGLSVRRFHPHRRFLFSLVRALSGLSLFLPLILPLQLSLSLSVSLLSSLVALSSPSIPRASSSRARPIDVRPAIEHCSIYTPSGYGALPITGRTDCTATAASLVVCPSTSPQSQTARRSGMALRQTRKSRSRTG